LKQYFCTSLWGCHGGGESREIVFTEKVELTNKCGS